MTVDVALLLSIVSVFFAIFSGIINLKRNQTTDTKNETTQLTTVLVELKYISNGITDIKHELSNVKEDIQQLRDKNTSHSECIKNLIHRVTDIEKRIEKYHTIPAHSERTEKLNE